MFQSTSTQHAALPRQEAGLIHHVLSTFLRVVYEHRAPLVALAAYAASLLIYIKVFELEELAYFALYGMTGVYLFGLTMASFLIIYAVRIQLRDKPERLIPHVATKLKHDFFTLDRFFSAGIAITLFTLLLATFPNFKRMIPEVIPFHLDTLFYEMDRWIHFGIDPWRLLQPIFGHPAMTFFINFLYNVWLFLIIMVFYWQAFANRDKQLRMQFILSFMLCWMLIGSLAATLLSSAGPCYFHRFGNGQDVYAPLMEYLRAANEVYPIWALDIQQTLLASFDSKSTEMASGITAMPSMHLSIAWLMVLLGWRVNSFAGWAFTMYCAFIMVGSVHLGWHYAVDGYASIIMTTIIWRASGWLSNKMPATIQAEAATATNN